MRYEDWEEEDQLQETLDMEFYGIGSDGEMLVKDEETGAIQHLSHVDAHKFMGSLDKDRMKELTADLAYVLRGASGFLMSITTDGVTPHQHLL